MFMVELSGNYSSNYAQRVPVYFSDICTVSISITLQYKFIFFHHKHLLTQPQTHPASLQRITLPNSRPYSHKANKFLFNQSKNPHNTLFHMILKYRSQYIHNRPNNHSISLLLLTNNQQPTKNIYF